MGDITTSVRRFIYVPAHGQNDQRMAGQYFEYISDAKPLLCGAPDQHPSAISFNRSLEKEHGIEISLARRGHPCGYAERLIRTLKEEEVHLDYEDITEARQ